MERFVFGFLIVGFFAVNRVLAAPGGLLGGLGDLNVDNIIKTPVLDSIVNEENTAPLDTPAMSEELKGDLENLKKREYMYDKDSDMYYKAGDIRMTWVDARNFCFSDKAALAMPRDIEELQGIMKVLEPIAKTKLHEDSAWLGFHDLFQDDDYVDLKGMSVQYYHNHWEHNQPNNFGNVQHCGALTYGSEGLNDENCEKLYVFVCEKPGKTPKKPVGPLPHPISNDPGYKCNAQLKKCYKLNTNVKAWAQARSICTAEGGHLAVITSKQERNYLMDFMQERGHTKPFGWDRDRVLIGFHDLFKEGQYTTVTDEPLWDGNDRVSQHRMAGGTQRNCGTLHISGGFDDFPCDRTARFICERSE